MIRDLLVGLIFLALYGLALELLGPTMTIVLGGSALVGALLRYGRRVVVDEHRRSTFPRPIGRVSRGR